MVCQSFVFGYDYLFGDFQVSDPIDTLVWTGDDGLFSSLAILVLIAYCVGWIGYITFGRWRSCTTAAARRAAAQELDAQEAAWKEEWLKDAEEKLRAAAGGGKNGEKAPPEEAILPPSDPLLNQPPESDNRIDRGPWIEDTGQVDNGVAASEVPEVKCRSCGNTGRDFMGNPCSCPYGKEIQEPEPDKAEPTFQAIHHLAHLPEPPAVIEEKRIEEPSQFQKSQFPEARNSQSRERIITGVSEVAVLPRKIAPIEVSAPRSLGLACFYSCCVTEQGKKEFTH